MFVVEDEVALRKAVETGFSQQGMVEILDGLSDTDNVIIVGQVGLKNEARVTIVDGDD